MGLSRGRRNRRGRQADDEKSPGEGDRLDSVAHELRLPFSIGLPR